MTGPKLNIVFLGGFSYPMGMAGAKRVQHAIDGLRIHEDVSIRVIITRQSSKENTPCGNHKGIPYETVMPNLMRAKMALWAPLLWLKAIKALMRAWRPGWRNVIYKYGPPSIDDMFPVRYARRRGYLVVYDIVEDDELARNLYKSLWHKIQNIFIRHATSRIKTLADGIIVISSHLERKFINVTSGAVPIHFHPISVDMDRFSGLHQGFSEPVTLFYGGGFGPSKGVDNLIKAFDILMDKGSNLRLVLTGPDNEKHLPHLLSVCKNEASKKSIEYRGYLDDDEYYRTLYQADIPCVPRADMGHAHAGFPFKLAEYLATGKPVVVSDVSDIGRFLKNHCHAVIVKPGSVDSLVDGISYLLSYPDKASAIGSRGRLAAREFFDYKTQALHLHSFFQNLVKRQ